MEAGGHSPSGLCVSGSWTSAFLPGTPLIQLECLNWPSGVLARHTSQIFLSRLPDLLPRGLEPGFPPRTVPGPPTHLVVSTC